MGRAFLIFAAALLPCCFGQEVHITAGAPRSAGLSGLRFGLPPIEPIPPLGLTAPPVRPHRSRRQGGFLAPFFWYDYYPGYYSQPNEPAPNVVVIVPESQAAPAPAPPPQPARPELREYKAPDQPGQESATFDIVGRDGQVTHAVAVWVEGGSVHFITPDGSTGVLPLEAVDRQATRDANARRGLTLCLPAPAAG